MTGFDQLERQLKASISELTPDAARPPAKRGWLVRRRTLAAVLAVPLVVGGVAGAAKVLSGPDASTAEALVAQVVRETSSTGPCQLVDAGRPGATVDVIPAAPIADLFQGGRSDQRAVKQAQAQSGGAAVLKGSPRILDFSGLKTRVLVFATIGTGGSVRADPAACGRVRQDRLERETQDTSASVRHAALAMLAAQRDTAADAQALNVEILDGSTSFGAALPVEPGVDHPTGVVAHDEHTYVGLAARGAATVEMTEAGATTSVPVQDGVFAAKLDGDHAEARHIAPNGRVLFTEVLRPGDR
jgi:hypothetical protein